MLKPKHTLESVATELINGLKNGSVALDSSYSEPVQTTDQSGISDQTEEVSLNGIVIKGTISGEAKKFVFNGTFDGSISLPDARIEFGEAARVVADIEGKEIWIDGNVTGDVNGSEKITIRSSGRVRGNLMSPRVTLHDGSKFKGSIDMDPSDFNAHSQPLPKKPMPKESQSDYQSGGNVA